MKKQILSLVACLVVAAGVSVHNVSAAALNYSFGDSRASGLGLAPLPNATQQDTDCGRSSQAYSQLAANAAGAINTNFACSGATLYGVWDQLNAAAALNLPKPQYVTFTDGANDVGWGQIISDCQTKDNCGGTTSLKTFNQNIVTYKSNLKIVLDRIHTDFAPGQILVAGYGPLFGNDKTCGVSFGITKAEAATIDSRVAAIDQAMADVVATVPTATYVPISFYGEGICTKTDAPIKGLGQSYFAHPTLKGQQIVANTVLSYVK